MAYPTEGPPESNVPEPQQPAAGSGATRRPWSVTSAAVIAFVLAAPVLWGAAADLIWLRSSECCLRVGLDNIVIAALLIWYGVRVLRGVSSKSLFIVAVAIIAVNGSLIIIALANGGDVGQLWVTVQVTLPVVLSMIIIPLLVQQSSRQFFRARGGTAI
jgi:hypothetical protein